MGRQLIHTVMVLFFAAAVTAQTYAQKSTKKQNTAETEIRALFETTAIGWNEGNLEKYLSVYTPDATEMLANGPAGGVEAIEKTMKEGFWKTGRPIQKLRYESIVVRMLGKKVALVTGQFVLSGANRADRAGWFTSVWEKTKKGWRIIHDHS